MNISRVGIVHAACIVIMIFFLPAQGQWWDDFYDDYDYEDYEYDSSNSDEYDSLMDEEDKYGLGYETSDEEPGDWAEYYDRIDTITGMVVDSNYMVLTPSDIFIKDRGSLRVFVTAHYPDEDPDNISIGSKDGQMYSVLYDDEGEEKEKQWFYDYISISPLYENQYILVPETTDKMVSTRKSRGVIIELRYDPPNMQALLDDPRMARDKIQALCDNILWLARNDSLYESLNSLDTMEYLCRRFFFVFDSSEKSSLKLTAAALHDEYLEILKEKADSLRNLKPVRKSDFEDTSDYNLHRTIRDMDTISLHFINNCAIMHNFYFFKRRPFSDKDVSTFKNADGTTVQAFDGRTLLIIGCQQNFDRPLIEKLLNNGADKSVKDRYGKTALDYCYENNNTKLIALLKGRSGMPPKVSKGLTWLVVGGLFGGTAAYLRSTADGHYKKAQDYYDLFREQPQSGNWTSYETEYKAYANMMRTSDVCYYCAGGCAAISILYFIFGPSEPPGQAAIYSDDHMAVSLAPTGDGVSLFVDIKGGRP